MKYKIQNVVVLEVLDGVEIRDIIYEELSEQEFLVKYLQNPDLMYWVIHDDGTRDFYRNGKHMANVDVNGLATNIPGIKQVFNNKD
jgi:hypothetical protein